MNTTPGQQTGPGTDDNQSPVANAADEILVVYDWECPACALYCRQVSVRPSAGALRLVNAREPTAAMEEITKARFDIDQGMVVKIGSRLYYGSDAIHALALFSSRSDLFNKLSYFTFRSAMLSRIFYPGLRACRNLLLKVMGKTKINNLGIKGNDRFLADESAESVPARCRSAQTAAVAVRGAKAARRGGAINLSFTSSSPG